MVCYAIRQGLLLNGGAYGGRGAEALSHPVLIERETLGGSGTAVPPREGAALQFLSPWSRGHPVQSPMPWGIGGW